MKLLITGAFPYSEEQISLLKCMGFEVYYVQDERIPLCEQNISFEMNEIEGIICNGLFLYNDIKAFQNLKYIQLTSAGYDRIPMDYIQKNGIEIHNARGVYSIPMAEFAICGVLQLLKKSRFFFENQKKHQWEKYRSIMELAGKTVCIVGCGSVGTECAKRFQTFGCYVKGIDLCPREDENYENIFGLEYLEQVLPESDVVVLTLPLTDETRYLMNARNFGIMKQGAVFVNIARGAVVDTDALIKNIPHLGGAVLDVFEEEPLGEDSPLWEMENVILTPHNSFVGENNQKRLIDVIISNLRTSGIMNV